MQKATRILSLLLCLCLVFALMAGCGTDDEAGQPTEAPSQSGNGEESTDEPDDSQGGDLLFDPTSYPLVDDGSVSFTALCRFQTNLLSNLASGDWDTNPAYKQSVETTGVSLEFSTIATENYTDQFNISVSSGDYPDFYDVFPITYKAGCDDAIEQGIIIDLSPYLQDYAPDYWAIVEADDDVRKGSTTDSGNMPAFYQIKMVEDWSANRGPMIRQDWLDDLNLDVPVTYDDLHDVLTAFKNEKGATKSIFMTMYGVLCGSSVATGYDVAVGTNGVDPFLYQVDGKVLCGFQQEGYKQYLTMLHQWYDEGLISGDFVGAEETFGWGDNIHNAVANGESGYWIAEYRNSATSWADENVDPNCVISAIPEAVQTPGQTIHLNSNGGRIDYPGFSITTACENVELAVAYLNYWFSHEGIILQNYGFEGETYTCTDANDWTTYKLTDVVLNDPDGQSAEKMAYTYCFFQTATLLDNKRFLPTDIEDDRKTWASNKDGAYDLPKDSVLSITVDESTKYSTAFGEVLTYTQETTAKFITGEMSLESDWQTFQDTIVQLGIQDCIDVYQAALDRYNAR